jgi:predicted permease
MDSELRFHLEQQIADYLRAGLPEEEARRRAALEFGPLELAKDECRDQRPLPWIETLLQDIRFAARGFRRSPGFALVCLLTLALGIGTTTAVFTVVSAMVIRDLPYPAADRMIFVQNRNARNRSTFPYSHMSQFREWQQRAASFEALAAYNAFSAHSTFNWTGRSEPERLTGVEVSQSLFPLLGAKPLVGRLFEAGEDLPGAAPVVVLSFDLWQRRFGARPEIAGEKIILNDQPYVVAGVLPPDFRFTGAFVPGAAMDIYVPLVQEQRAERFGFYLGVVGRLKPGVAPTQARQELTALHDGLFGKTPLSVFTPEPVRLADHVYGALRTPLWLLMGSVGLVLLVGCANLANLFLARAAARRREIALRAALGAHRGRLIRQMLTESLVLAAAGAVAGVGLAYGLVRYLRQAAWLVMPRLQEVHIDLWVLLFAAGVCVLTAVLCGLAPALAGTRMDVATGLKDGGWGASSGPSHGRLRATLVAAQVTLSLVLLTGAGLLARSMLRLLDVQPGFQPERVAAMRVDPGRRYPRGPRLTAFFDSVLERVRSLPGIEAAALAINLPLDRTMVWDFALPGDARRLDLPPVAAARIASPGYFATMRIPMLWGRDFTSDDTAESQPVVIVNQTLARFINGGGQQPLNALVRIGGRERKVIGVVADVRHAGLHREAGNEIYLVHTQSLPIPAVDVVVRSALPASALYPAVRRAVWSVDPSQPVGKIISLSDLVDKSLSPRTFLTWSLGAFAAFALLLACTGVYGVVSYAVTQRTREIGVRMALGSRRNQIWWMILLASLKTAFAGLALGIAVSFAATRLLSGQLYGVTPTDPATFLVTAGVLLAAVAVAASIPALRATRLDARTALLSDV